jgi:hypothetical protein
MSERSRPEEEQETKKLRRQGERLEKETEISERDDSSVTHVGESSRLRLTLEGAEAGISAVESAKDSSERRTVEDHEKLERHQGDEVQPTVEELHSRSADSRLDAGDMRAAGSEVRDSATSAGLERAGEAFDEDARYTEGQATERAETADQQVSRSEALVERARARKVQWPS